jgi:hypothetical protein
MSLDVLLPPRSSTNIGIWVSTCFPFLKAGCQKSERAIVVVQEDALLVSFFK